MPTSEEYEKMDTVELVGLFGKYLALRINRAEAKGNELDFLELPFPIMRWIESKTESKNPEVKSEFITKILMEAMSHDRRDL